MGRKGGRVKSLNQILGIHGERTFDKPVVWQEFGISVEGESES